VLKKRALITIRLLRFYEITEGPGARKSLPRAAKWFSCSRPMEFGSGVSLATRSHPGHSAAIGTAYMI